MPVFWFARLLYENISLFDTNQFSINFRTVGPLQGFGKVRMLIKIMPDQLTCFHCAQPVPEGFEASVSIQSKPQPMCCHGCASVAEAIVDAGMESYYTGRSAEAQTASEIVPEFLKGIKAFDLDAVQKSFVEEAHDHSKSVTLVLEGITCAACIWLNEQYLKSLPGVISVMINYSNHRAVVHWHEGQIKLSEILEAISRIGYIAHPYDPSKEQQVFDRQRSSLLRRIGIAGLFGMQVMTLAVAMYSGDWWGMEPEFLVFFQWLSLLLIMPVIFYSAWPFFNNAWRNLRSRHLGMDVPVSLGMGVAFIASLKATLSGSGEVYYDSIAMFTFLLLLARLLEHSVRRRSYQATDRLTALQPASATRLDDAEAGGDTEQMIPVAEIKLGDRVLIRPGEAIPIDGIIQVGRSSVNEAMLTGESIPVAKAKGDTVIAGSINIESQLVAEVNRLPDKTVLASIIELMSHAQTRKPGISELADRIASGFVLVVLVMATLVAGVGYWLQPDHWVAATISVFIVTCPCALSLATPAALTAVMGALSQQGILVTSSRALETLLGVSRFAFDKTGTLTTGQMRVSQVVPANQQSSASVLNLARKLESGSEHPIARAICAAAASHPASVLVENLINHPGEGVSGDIDGEAYWLGKPGFIATQTGIEVTEVSNMSQVVLAKQGVLIGVIELEDSVRPQAKTTIGELQGMQISTIMLTGDQAVPAKKLAEELAIDEVFANLKPEDKLKKVSDWQDQGISVAMIGDGINDAPVLAQANLSISMGGGTQLAATHADILLLSDQLSDVITVHKAAQRTRKIIQQNLGWALVYNLTALPLAAMGLVAPWMAAIGMSLSSLVVVANSVRAGKLQDS